MNAAIVAVQQVLCAWLGPFLVVIERRPMPWVGLTAGVPVGADGAGGAAESIVNQTAVDVLRRLPVSDAAPLTPHMLSCETMHVSHCELPHVQSQSHTYAMRSCGCSWR